MAHVCEATDQHPCAKQHGVIAQAKMQLSSCTIRKIAPTRQGALPVLGSHQTLRWICSAPLKPQRPLLEQERQAGLQCCLQRWLAPRSCCPAVFPPCPPPPTRPRCLASCPHCSHLHQHYRTARNFKLRLPSAERAGEALQHLRSTCALRHISLQQDKAHSSTCSAH